MCHNRDCNGHGVCHEVNVITLDDCREVCDDHDDCYSTCLPRSSRAYECACDERWVGRDCELTHCTDDTTCFNGATCTYVDYVSISRAALAPLHRKQNFDTVNRVNWRVTLARCHLIIAKPALP